MLRTLEPEWLDSLDAADPRAQRSRRDLRLVNALMGNARAVARALAGTLRAGAKIADVGAGDGAFMLRVAKKMPTRAELVLVDRADAVGAETVAQYRAIGWTASAVRAEAAEWLQQAPQFDAIVANLFLHHFEAQTLRALLALISKRTRLFVACEPRRSGLALAGSRALALLGCGAETRHDAVVSVRAGFRGRELSSAWPPGTDWDLSERASGPFAHLFLARRNA
jgi:2-polyprenyl-3-methyl-5-hydroxy-6-metoxy-1,4-benzoquinol methylase